MTCSRSERLIVSVRSGLGAWKPWILVSVAFAGIDVALPAQNFLDAVVAPARPVVGGEHDVGLKAEAVQRLTDVF